MAVTCFLSFEREFFLINNGNFIFLENILDLAFAFAFAFIYVTMV